MYTFHKQSVSASELHNLHLVSKKYIHAVCITIRCTHNKTYYYTELINHVFVIEAEAFKSFEQNAVVLLAYVVESLR